MQRDPIYAAIVSQLTALRSAPYNVEVVSRGFVPWENADLQPAIYVVPVTEDGKYRQGLPTVWTLKIDLYVYVRWIDSVEQGVTALAQIMDGIDATFSPINLPNAGQPNSFTNTLDGLVQYCALQGASDISGGFLNKAQTIARMPVEVQVA